MAKYKYQRSRETFVNPYTFVPVNFHRKQTEDIEEAVKNATELLTGVLKCTIYAKTPLAFPDISAESEKDGHKSYPFMSMPDGAYGIQASSLRGEIRNVFETASDSCFSTLREDTRLNARKENARSAGLLLFEDGVWKLYEAKRYMLKTKGGTSNGRVNVEVWSDKVPTYNVKRSKNETYIAVRDNTQKKGIRKIHSGEMVRFFSLKDAAGEEIQYKKEMKNGTVIPCAYVAKGICADPNAKRAQSGYLVLGETISNKHHESIFEKKGQKKIPQIEIERAMACLDETVNVYRSKINKKYPYSTQESSQSEDSKEGVHNGYPEYETMKKNGCIPVWFTEENRRLVFSPAAIGRISYQKTLNQHIDQKQPCKTRDHLCKACRLFGMAQKDAAVGGRIRFTDAIMENPEMMGKAMVPLAELGEPKPSYMPFYSTMTVKMDRKNQVIIPGYDDQEVTIRGRKYYWHSTDFKKINQDTPISGPDAKRNASMQLAGIGSRFSFDVYFDRITPQELKELVWTLNFWENKADGVMCHKIGHGKPIGLGSVKITVDHILCRTFSAEDGYRIIDGVQLIDYSSEEPFHDTAEKGGVQTIAALKKICNFQNAMKTRYPYIAVNGITKYGPNDIANHKWFGENKSSGMRGHEHPMQLLPGVLERSQELNAYEIQELPYSPGQNKRER